MDLDGHCPSRSRRGGRAATFVRSNTLLRDASGLNTQRVPVALPARTHLLNKTASRPQTPRIIVDVPRWWCGCQTPSGPDRVVQMSPHHRGQPESIPYRVAKTTYHEERPLLPWNSFSLSSVRCPMSASAPSAHLFVGVDIAAASFAAAWSLNGSPPERARSFSQTPDGFAAFQAALATSGLEPGFVA